MYLSFCFFSNVIDATNFNIWLNVFYIFSSFAYLTGKIFCLKKAMGRRQNRPGVQNGSTTPMISSSLPYSIGITQFTFQSLPYRYLPWYIRWSIFPSNNSISFIKEAWYGCCQMEKKNKKFVSDCKWFQEVPIRYSITYHKFQIVSELNSMVGLGHCLAGLLVLSIHYHYSMVGLDHHLVDPFVEMQIQW